MHKNQSAAMCERTREYNLHEDICRSEGVDKHFVLVLFNPDQKHTPAFRAYAKLGETLRDAFVTRDVEFATDGVLRRYLGYSPTRIREIESQYAMLERGHMDQYRVLKQTVEGAAHDAELEEAQEARDELPEESLKVRTWCLELLTILKKRATAEMMDLAPEKAFRAIVDATKSKEDSTSEKKAPKRKRVQQEPAREEAPVTVKRATLARARARAPPPSAGMQPMMHSHTSFVQTYGVDDECPWTF